MIHDPTDERYRKPRRLRNTELQKWIRNASLVTVSFYAVALYINWKRNEALYTNNERKIKFTWFQDPDNTEILQDYEHTSYKNVYDRVTKFWKKEAVSEAVSEAAKDNIQTDK